MLLHVVAGSPKLAPRAARTAARNSLGRKNRCGMPESSSEREVSPMAVTDYTVHVAPAFAAALRFEILPYASTRQG